MQFRQRVQAEKVPEARYKKVCVRSSHKQALLLESSVLDWGWVGRILERWVSRPRCGRASSWGNLRFPRLSSLSPSEGF